METIDFRNMTITIVGLGMEGGSYAIAAKNYLKPKKLFAIDINEDVLIAAEKLKVIDQGFVNPIIPLQASDLVILCVYPSDVIRFVRDNMTYFKSGAVLTDAAGVKRKIVDDLSNIIREDIDFVPGHPMAGNEFKGFLYADKKIFEGNSYLITPTSKNKQQSLSLIESMALKFGCSKIYITDPDTHDTKIAYASQLMHLIASSIVNCDSYTDDMKNFVGGSFRSATRVANINPDLWTDAFFENKDKLLEQIDYFMSNITLVKSALIHHDKKVLHSFFEKSYHKSNSHDNL
jgi:prephenate dehydrogenase